MLFARWVNSIVFFCVLGVERWNWFSRSTWKITYQIYTKTHPHTHTHMFYKVAYTMPLKYASYSLYVIYHYHLRCRYWNRLTHISLERRSNISSICYIMYFIYVVCVVYLINGRLWIIHNSSTIAGASNMARSPWF